MDEYNKKDRNGLFLGRLSSYGVEKINRTI
jgi:hypothetical protein